MTKKPALHVVSLPHTQVTKEYVACAYTQKHLKFCTMMKSIGYDVYSYASEENEADVTEHIEVISKADQEKFFGDNNFHSNFFNITWGPDEEHWVHMNNNAIKEIGKRIKPGDIICLIAGVCQASIKNAFPNNISVEYGIGYTGVFSDFKVFESYAHMHYVYGEAHNDDGKFYDCVIPNYFDPDDFEFSKEKDDYFLFIGRLIIRKGPEIAVEVSRRLDTKLIMAGQGVASQENGIITATDGAQYTGNITHVGHVDAAERSELMKKAKAVFVPTTYLEPFGGVSIEAMMCGTPVIASDFGAFPENVIHGLSGFRFRTLGEATYYANMVDSLDPEEIRRYAVNNFSTERAATLYDQFFQQLATLNHFSKNPDGHRRDGFYSDWHGSLDRYSKKI